MRTFQELERALTRPVVAERVAELVEAIRELREAAYGDSNDAEIEAGHAVADLAQELLAWFGVEVPEVPDPYDDAAEA